MRNSTIPYYFKYYIQDQQLNIFGSTINLASDTFLSAFLTIGTAATIIGAILTKWFTKIFDKKNTYSWFLILSAIFCGLLYFVSPGDIILIFALNIGFSFLVGPVSVLQWAMYTDTVDYSEWKNKRRATGLIMSASLFALKLGLTLGGAIVGWILGYYGFIANQPQSIDTINGIRLLISGYPAIFGIIGGLLILFYPLTNETMIKIEEDLTARKDVITESVI